jgi:hypothetical protein
MKKILICDKNKALANFIKSKLSENFIVEKYNRRKFEMIKESYLVCILIIYDKVDLFDLVTITRYQKNIIIGTSSKELIDFIKRSKHDIPFFDFRDSKNDISLKLERLIYFFDE